MREFSLEAFNNGHLTGLEKVIQYYSPDLNMYADNFVGIKEVSKDIVTNAFIKLWCKHSDITSTENIRAFLHMSVSRAAARFNKQLSTLSTIQAGQLFSLGKDYLDHYANQTYAVAEIENLFQRLPNDCKTVMELSFKIECTDKFIATHLDLATTEVKQQLISGMQLIGEMLIARNIAQLDALKKLIENIGQLYTDNNN